MALRLPLLAAVTLVAVGTPLPAAARDSEGREPGEIARKLSDPGNQVAATVALTALSEAILDMRIEPMRRALAAVGDPAAEDLPPDARLRDLTGRRGHELPGEIGRRVPKAMGAAAGMAGAVEDMLPELRALSDRVRAAIPRD